MRLGEKPVKPAVKSEPVDVRSILLAETPVTPEQFKSLEQAVAGHQAVEVRQMLGEVETRLRSNKTPRDLTAAGLASYLLGRHEQAAEYLKQVGDNPLAVFYLGEAYMAMRQYDDAVATYSQASELGYDKVLCVLRRVGAIRQAGKLDEAEQLLAKHAREAATRAEYSYQRGCLLSDRGDTYGAIEYFERAVDMDSRHAGALFRLASLNDLLGNDDEAIRLYEQSLSKPPLFLGSLLNLGVLYEDQENYAAAAYCFRRVLDVYPNHERARLFLKDIEAAGQMYYDEDALRRERELEQVLRVPVTDFELSARARNCLDRASIVTLGDLTRISESDLLAGKNFGETSLNEIRDMMAAKGLRIGQLQRLELAAPTHAPSHTGFGGGAAGGGGGGGGAKPQQYQDDLTPAERANLERPVGDLGLSVRSRKCLSRLGIVSLAELCSRTADELLSVRNFGVTSLNEIRLKLTDFDLRLRND